MGYRLLSVTKDKLWAKIVARCFAGPAGSCETTGSLSEAWSRIVAGQADAALLDIDMPALERLSWLRMLRRTDEWRAFPIVLASRRKSDAELAEAFELGADDYVLKSCDERELVARLRSVLRRRLEASAISEEVL